MEQPHCNRLGAAPWLGLVFKWQPELFEVPQQMGSLSPGTILLAGNSIGPNGQQIEIYMSTDQGHTWTYRSTVDSSVGAKQGGIWEPNLQLASDGSLMVYYSDETQEPTFNQALVEKQSMDGGLTWGTKQNVVAVSNNDRPGMAVTAKLPDGRYIMSYEDVGTPSSQVHIRYSPDGINWGNPGDEGTPIATTSGSFLGATPYIAWTPLGGGNGALFVSAQNLVNSTAGDRELMVSTDLGSTWNLVPAPVQWQGGSDCVANGADHAGWSQAMLPTADNTGLLHLASSYIGDCKNEIRFNRETINLQ